MAVAKQGGAHRYGVAVAAAVIAIWPLDAGEGWPGPWWARPSGLPERPAYALQPAAADPRSGVRDLDSDEVLTKLAALPVRVWRDGQDPPVWHMGPAARDFHAAFGLGGGAQQIEPLDESGVALRAVQALDARTRAHHEQLLHDTDALAAEAESLVQLNAERAAEIAALKDEIAALRRQIGALRRERR